MIKELTMIEVVERPTKTGKKFWGVKTTEGVSASIWDAGVALHAQQNIGIPQNYVIEEKGQYTNITSVAPPGTAEVDTPAPATPTPATAPVTPRPMMGDGIAARIAAVDAASRFHNSATDDLNEMFATADLIVEYISSGRIAVQKTSSKSIDALDVEKFTQ